jgi:DNA-binding MarR family transcriptional regulator
MEDDSRQRVGLVPISIFQHADCGCEEQGIYGFMSTHACRRGYLWLGLATIAEAVKLDRGKVRRRLEKLIALGFVERMPHPDPEIRCWMYRLIGHDQILTRIIHQRSG